MTEAITVYLSYFSALSARALIMSADSSIGFSRISIVPALLIDKGKAGILIHLHGYFTDGSYSYI